MYIEDLQVEMKIHITKLFLTAIIMIVSITNTGLGHNLNEKYVHLEDSADSSDDVMEVQRERRSADSHANHTSDRSTKKSGVRQNPSSIVFQRMKEGKRMPQLTIDEGYPTQTHEVETKDGYFLTMHRIQGKNVKMQSPRVALLWHGLFGSSADWILSGPGHALAYLLADQDYDVWMANARGNIYSQKHKTFDTNSPEFWNFSIHEIGSFDVSACIDYVMKTTKIPRILAITHSTGVAAVLITLNEKSVYQNKLYGLVSMAPATALKFTSSQLSKLLMSSYRLLKNDIIEKYIGTTYMSIPDELYDLLGDDFCDETGPAAEYCKNPLFMITGYPKQPYKPDSELINANTPAGTSAKLLRHMAQMALSGEFHNFDYGEDKNQIKYGYSWAPDYIIDKLMTRITFFYAKDDSFVSDQDVSVLARNIARLNSRIKVKRPDFGHMDFLYATDAREMVYNRLLRELTGLVGQ